MKFIQSIATMSRKSEWFLLIFAAFFAGFLGFIYSDQMPNSKNMASSAMALGLIVAGFTETQRNMLLSMSGSKVLRFAAKTGYYKNILNYLAECVYAGLFVTFISLIGFFLADHIFLQSIWSAFWFGSILLMILILGAYVHKLT